MNMLKTGSAVSVVIISSLCIAFTTSSESFVPPSPEQRGASVNSGIGTTATQHSSSILLEPRNGFDAVTSCAMLGETLLAVNGTHFTSDVTSILAFLNFQGKFPIGQEFWVSSSSKDICRTVTNEARLSSSSCARVLPVLCSQSAPFRPSGDQVKKPEFEVTIQAQDLTITGYRDQLSFRFLGIPYANPPERFTYSTLFSGPQKIFNATVFGSQCVQSGGGGSEDCLFLNIFTPFIPGPSNRDPLKSVIVHIHGGAFTSGSANDATFDGGNMVSRGDVVVVDINYRLSTLGFLALNDGMTNGSFGIADQTVALQWVKKYISSFGGDPNRIVIMGQSAGAASVRALLASPKAISNIAAAIPMSNLAGLNFATTFSQFFTIPEAVSLISEPILQETGCNLSNSSAILACLRAISAQSLVDLTNVASDIVVDGTFVTTTHLPVDGSAPVAHVPVLQGFMRDDGAAFIGFPDNDDLLDGVSAVIFNIPAESVIDSGLFPEPSGSNATLNVFNVTARLITDVEFRCLDQAAAISAVKHNVFRNTWFYEFNKSYQTPGFDPNAPVCDAPKDAAHPLGDTSQEYFKCHSGELFFVWANLGQFALPFRDETDLLFTQFVMDIWTSFARTFDPNPQLAFLEARNYTNTIEQLRMSGPWNPLSLTDSRTLRLLDFPAKLQSFSEEAQCNFTNLPFNFYENSSATLPVF